MFVVLLVNQLALVAVYRLVVKTLTVLLRFNSKKAFGGHIRKVFGGHIRKVFGGHIRKVFGGHIRKVLLSASIYAFNTTP